MLLKLDTSRRLAKWAIELGEHDINYRPRASIKGQTLADFLIEIPNEIKPLIQAEDQKDTLGQAYSQCWTLYTDRASNKEGSRASLRFTYLDGEEVTYELRFDFHTSNNKAKYEALLADLQITRKMRVEKITTLSDSRLATNQVSGEFETKDKRMEKYVRAV